MTNLGRGANLIHIGDCLDVMRTLPDESVQTCITSPPYWGLRDYGTAKWVGGDNECNHVEMSVGMSDKNTLGNGGHPPTNAANIGRVRQYKDECKKCGAIRVDGQLGLEKSPEEYVAKMVEVFREVRRLLKGDGTLWMNLGDSYNSSPSNQHSSSVGANGSKVLGNTVGRQKRLIDGLKPKDLVGIPWRVAFALQADGWYLRQDIIWHKPNPMPESVRDRCTKAHEYVFLMAKSSRYYYDADAVREDATQETRRAATFRNGGDYTGSNSFGNSSKKAKDSHGDGDRGFGRNRRSVWTITPKPFKEAHFATYPPALVEPCILAGSRPGDTVLDPFNGAGTTGLVAAKLGRKYIGIELNPEYAAMAERRIAAELAKTELFASAPSSI